MCLHCNVFVSFHILNRKNGKIITFFWLNIFNQQINIISAASIFVQLLCELTRFMRAKFHNDSLPTIRDIMFY